MRMKARALAAALTVVLAGTTLTACMPAGSTHSCVSWVDLADAQAMYADAVLVVAGTAGPADGTVELFAGPGERHVVTVDEVYKGNFDGTELWAASPRDYCVAEPPSPADDPIPSAKRVLLYLRPASEKPTAVGVPLDLDDVEAWSTLTPLAGVVPFPDGAELPFDTEG